MYKINDVVVYKRDVCRVVGREKSGFTVVKILYFEFHIITQMVLHICKYLCQNKAGHLRRDLITKE